MNISIREKNEKFIGLLTVSGKLESFSIDKLKELRECKIDLEEASKKIKKFIRKYDKQADLDEIYKNSLYICTCLDKYHKCEDFNSFLDEFLALYESSSSSAELRKLKSLNTYLTYTVTSSNYELNLDALKIRTIKYDKIEYKDINLDCKVAYDVLRNGGLFPEIILENEEKLYAYIVKNGNVIKISNIKYAGIDDDYSCEWIWVKSTREIIDIILKRDYDFIFLPSLKGQHGFRLLDRLDIKGMSNRDFIDLSVLVGKIVLTHPSYIEKLNVIAESEWDLKELLTAISSVKYYSDYEKMIDAILVLLDKLRKIDKETGYIKLNTFAKIFDSFSYCTMKGSVFTDKLDNMSKMRNSSLDEFIMSAKLIESTNVSKIDISFLNRKTIRDDCFYILYSNNHIRTSNNWYKVKKELARDDVYIVTVPSEFNKNMLLE